jgi:hypothetical protein
VVVAFKEETGDKLIDWFPEQRFVHLITGDAELKLPPLLKPVRFPINHSFFTYSSTFSRFLL